MNVSGGDLLSRDNQAVALVHRDDGPGSITINAARPPGTAGVSGAGVVCVLSFQAKASGSTSIAMTRAAAITSTQQQTPPKALKSTSRCSKPMKDMRLTETSAECARSRARTDADRADCDGGDSLHSGRGGSARDGVYGQAGARSASCAGICGQMRDAIDHYKDAADKHAFQTKVDSQNYPPDLDTLVNGVDVQGKKVKFLRRIPGGPDDRQGGVGLAVDAGRSGVRLLRRAKRVRCVFEVPGNGLDGTKYSTW